MDEFSKPQDFPRSELSEVEHRLADLEDRFERLQLTCQAQWELLMERTEVTNGELLAKIDEIDSRDGTADHRLGHHPITCGQCGRSTTSRRLTCVYCGKELDRPHIFEV